MNDYVLRIHLKPGLCKDRKKLIDLCLRSEEQFLAIGWNGVYRSNNIGSYEDYYLANKAALSRVDGAINRFYEAQENDLFWTRDLDGCYWICRAKGKAEPMLDEELSIGAIIPVEAYPVGLEVPGQIKASFTRARGGTTQRIYDSVILEYSKQTFNQASGRRQYEVRTVREELLDNLPEFDLEELVISYLQLKENYYLLSNSIALKSTTPKIECELIHRDIPGKKAVVQVKGGHDKALDARDYTEFLDSGFTVYLYAPVIRNSDISENCVVITKEDLNGFFKENRQFLPASVTMWESIINKD